MNKNDLKSGMIVTLRRGVEVIIIGSCLFNEDGTTGILNYYNDDFSLTDTTLLLFVHYNILLKILIYK